MAVKTRTPRTSSGVNAQRKEARRDAQALREVDNLNGLRAIPGGEQFLSRTDHRGVTRHVRPSVALRSAKRAKRFAQQVAKSKD